jgi:hyperosmotically inducible periplasmic protein
MKRLFPSTLAVLTVSVLVTGGVDAKTFELNGKTYDPGKVISDSEADGTLTKEQASQFREDEKKIADKEKKDRDKKGGKLSRNEEKGLAKKLDDLMKRIDKVRTAKADNSQRNVGDQRKEARTPDKQSQDKNDIKMLGSIRRKLMGDKSLSTNAKNVKVISNKGEITLRGPVDTADEKAKVEAAVSSVAGNAKVQSELEVLKK